MCVLRHDSQMRQALVTAGVITADQARADAGESLFILQELQAIEAKTYETPFGPLKSAELIPLDDSVPPGAEEWGYDRITPYGFAQWMAPDARDIPFSDVDRVRVTFPLKTMAQGYRYTINDLLAAQTAGRPLEPTLAMAARRGIDSFRDQVLLQGDASVGYSGFINDPSVTAANAAHGKWDGTGATSDQIIAEIQSTIYTIASITKEIYWPDTLVVPPAVYGYLTTTARSANSDTTIWEFVQANAPMPIRLVMLLQLGPNSDPGGVMGSSNTGRAIFYKRDPECVVAKVAVMFDQRPPQYVGLSVEIPCYAKIGGTHFRVPISAYYINGVR